MNETDYRSPLDNLIDEWEILTSSEKALCFSYRRLLVKGIKVNSFLIENINMIHQKYPEFHIGCIPAEVNTMENLQEGA